MINPSRGFRLALAIWLFICIFASAAPVPAQEGVQVWAAAPDTSGFPTITTYFEVRDAQGMFVTGLDQDAVTVIENGRRIPLSALEQLRAGVQLVVAINPGPSFAIRNSQGMSRFDFVMQALRAWSEARQGSMIDDLSLLANDHPDASHVTDAENWIAALDAYQPDTRNAVPDLTVMARAIDVAADVTARPGMGKAILFITTSMDVEAGVGLQSLGARAKQAGIHVFVWLVASTERFSSEPANQLKSLAQETEGSYFAYSGVEMIPELELSLEPLRNTYHMEYKSGINTSGFHEMAVQVQLEGSEYISSPIQFELEVLPPNIAFVSPRLKIERVNSGEAEANPETLVPSRENLEVLIEFPDGFERPIERSALYIDGEIAEVNTSPPFDQFSWDLREYTSTGEHVLRVEVEDSLGLSSTSMDTIVLVSLKRDPRSVIVTLSRNRSLLAGITVVLAGAVLMLVLVRGGRLKPGVLLEFRRRNRRGDPVTQPVRPKQEENQRPSAWIDRLHLTQRRLAPQAIAFLTPISEAGDESSRPPISIASSELTFGRNPAEVTQVIDDPSVEEIHARLSQHKNGSFRLADLGSVAGTWINYTPVSKEGAILEHGDLLHIGRVGFRFTLRNPHRVRKPVIIPLEPES
jgi:hypothetical protein